jgi:undecaprenyl diphosphate synthase
MTTTGQPDPDLIVRTGGEMRLSNFLIWQAAYAEYYSTPTYWPDFGRDDLIAAVEAYGQRQRRFGRVTAS